MSQRHGCLLTGLRRDFSQLSAPEKRYGGPTQGVPIMKSQPRGLS